MLPLIVIAGAVAMLWRLGYWPFDRSYTMLPQYSACFRSKPAAPPATRPGA